MIKGWKSIVLVLSTIDFTLLLTLVIVDKKKTKKKEIPTLYLLIHRPDQSLDLAAMISSECRKEFLI